MRSTTTTIATTLLGLLVSACGAVVGPTAQEMTLQSQNHTLGTQIAQLQSTATVEVDRMMITVEHAQTEVSGVQGQRDAMRGTAVARGTESSFFGINIPSNTDAEGGIADLPNGINPQGLLPQDAIADPLSEAPAVTPPANGNGPIRPNLDTATTPLPPVNATTQPSQDVQTATTGARLTNPTLSTGYDGNDCAVGASTSFPQETPEIYIVTNAVDFPAGTTVSTTWLQNGEVMDSYSYTYEFPIEGNCIWSFIDQTDFAFTPGNWSVEMQVNGGAGIGPINFTITGNGTAPDEMTDGTTDGQ